MNLIYRLIVLLFSVFIILNMFKENDFKKQINCSMVLIPLILRLLMIK